MSPRRTKTKTAPVVSVEAEAEPVTGEETPAPVVEDDVNDVVDVSASPDEPLPDVAPLAPTPAPNVVLEYRDQPGSEHVEVYLPEIASCWRPHTVRYSGRAFVQSRQRADGLWVYGSE